MDKVECPFEVPKPFKWNEDFQVFYQNLDDEHKQLFDAVFNLESDINAANLQSLVDVTVNHFKDEEGMMERSKYVNYPAHKKMHDDFVSKLKSLNTSNCSGAFDFAKKWLVQHIMTTDFKYKGLLEK